MQFNELKEQIKNVGLNDVRKDSENYFEAVVAKDNMKELINRLDNFFGKPVWPSRVGLSFQMQETIKEYGGIVNGQTLYFSNQDSKVIFAMLWPWENGKYTTVKIIQSQNNK